ncbi:MAG TPA: PhoH family protein [Spirochaetota bacterium]|nr:PhoH family protein [Spirochaetota bacterium]HOM38174.1 PhoH family protein [Spirochaetota bacterium]HPQ48608.1 PhoH family protein [Spirochaetota bacterium]
MEITVNLDPSIDLSIFHGFNNTNLKIIEESLNVSLFSRGETIKIIGENKTNIDNAVKVIEKTSALVKKKKSITESEIIYIIENTVNNSDEFSNFIKVSNNRVINLKTYHQKLFHNNILEKDLVFSIGPSGTGKTYIAVATGLSYLFKKKVNKLILTRPVVEAGESLGFLPGNLEEKINPYLRPLLDSIYDMLTIDEIMKYKEREQIEIAPLAYMRGRTLNNAFIILDEAQNTSESQIKMFLTRMGHNSKIVVTGDITQKDLPYNKKSGLEITLELLKNMKDVGFIFFDKKDIVRHPLVAKIIEAFEKYEKNQ